MRRFGLTLLELLITLAIIAILIGLLIPAISYARRLAREIETQALITDLELSLVNYRSEYNGQFPIIPGASTEALDKGDGTYTPPGFYQVECAPLGAASTGAEDNAALIKHLENAGRLKVHRRHLQNGRLVDAFGSPIVVRFLAVRTEGTTGLQIRPLIWSYGYNRRNEINATPVYVNQGLPVYDQAEVDRIKKSLGNSDDISNW